MCSKRWRRSPHLVAPNQAAANHQIEIAIDRGARDRRSTALHGVEQRLGIDVPMLGENLVKELEPPRPSSASPRGGQSP
jgi:hypothetical protein